MKKIKFIITLTQSIILLSGLVNSLIAESSSETQLKLQKAYFAERSEGDLDKAIELYQGIIEQNEADKQYVAQAMYQLGCCLEKKGETANAAIYFQKVASEYSEIAKWNEKAKIKLEGLSTQEKSIGESVFENGAPPKSVMPYLMAESFKALMESFSQDLAINIKVEMVDNSFNSYSGGFLAAAGSSEGVLASALKNSGIISSEAVDKYKYYLAHFNPEWPDMVVYDATGNKIDTEWLGSPKEGADLYWLAGRKLGEDEKHHFYYTHGNPVALSESNGSARFMIQNYFGPEVLELFFLVVPNTLEISEVSEEFASQKVMENYNIYLWKKRNPKNTNNIVKMTIKAAVIVSEADKLKSEDLAAQGWEFWKQRKLSEAEEIFKKAVDLNPNNESGWQGLGWTQLNMGKKENAGKTFEKCVKLNPENSAALNGLGWIANGQGDDDKAIEWWEKAVKAQPGATASLSGLVETYERRKDKKNTLKYLEMWNKAEPDNSDVKTKLENLKGGSEAKSPSKGDKAKSQNFASQGWKLWGQRKLSEAEDTFKKAIEIDSENENGWQGLGWTQLNQGKRDEAKLSFEKCVELNPKNSAALNGLGWIADGQGEEDKAIEWWEKAVDAQPGATASLSGLVNIYMERKDYEKAEKYLKMWQKVDPNNNEVKEKLNSIKGLKK